MLNVLFVCSRNFWRSPTAEAIYRDRQGINVRSAGTEPSARIKLNRNTVLWADIIFVMEKRHRQRMLEKFETEMADRQIIILDISDDYKFMDADLIEEIKAKVDIHLNAYMLP